jgi:putative transposase
MAIREVLPEAVFQLCYVHFFSNALDRLPPKADDDWLQELRWHSVKAIRRGGRSELAGWIAKNSACAFRGSSDGSGT